MEAEQVLGGRYRLERRLGEGGMSVVWLARDEVLGRPVAVKVLAARLAADEGSRRRIRAEAQAVARLSHPHITDVYDFGESIDEDGNQVPYIVMELLPGQTLAHRLAEGPLRPRAAMRVCAEVASALAAAHREGMVHRDVKPANVVLTPDGAKVVDFGIAAAVGQADEYDQNAPVFGTPAYLAPERLTGGEVVAASDVYALGLLLYRMITNELPWQVETTTQMLTAHVYTEPSPLPASERIPAEVARIYELCVAKDPADRPEAGEVAEVLASACGLQLRPEDDPSLVTAFTALGPDVTPEPPYVPRSARHVHRQQRKLPVVLGAGTAVVALVAGIFLLSGKLGDAGPFAAGNGGGKENSASGALHGELPGAVGNGGPTSPGKNSPKATNPGDIVPLGSTGPSQSPGPGVIPLPTTGGPEPTGGPTTPGAETSDPQPTNTDGTQSAETIDVRFDSDGGTVLASCDGKQATVHDPQPAEGYTVKKVKNGPSKTVGVVFTGSKTVHMRITCSKDGQASMTIDGSESL